MHQSNIWLQMSEQTLDHVYSTPSLKGLIKPRFQQIVAWKILTFLDKKHALICKGRSLRVEAEVRQILK
ncbi:hypothetical protein XELAEV_18028408mg [Xenopus laevis]|uniref:Uncharacterized protein n=1 Tax=Xenopus laevis TaxID=8355 RepID=A0A974CZM1_XENLA|nr:hypothetical protein XELAEV_18028408mg [Xenopus laevis]